MENDLLILIHTIASLADVFKKLAADMLPGVQLMHIVDEPLLEYERRGEQVTVEVSARLASHVALAEKVGADIALVTCSSISPNVDDVRPKAHIPVLKIDEPMIARAVETGAKIGVVATAASTLKPTRHLLDAQAEIAGKPIQIETVLVDGALPALLAGDGAKHDRMVKEATLELADRVDVVVLAQASMARVLEVIPEDERKVPLLSSPHLALEQVRRVLSETQGGVQ
jgi:Asp/Glu/hydantoin racemase